MDNKAVVNLEQVSFSYGKNSVLESIDLNIKQNEMVALIGLNGAGKTTLFDIVMRFLEPTGGKIDWGIKGDSFLYMTQGVGVSPLLSVEDTMKFILLLMGSEVKLEEAYKGWDIHFQHIFDRIRKLRIGMCSGGEYRIVILEALLSVPHKSMYILDEPTAWLDVYNKSLFWDMIRKKKEEGKSAIISTHTIEEMADRVFDRVLLLHNKKLVTYESMDHLRDSLGGKTAEEALLSLYKNNGMGK